MYKSKRLEYIVVCTATTTSKNSGSGFSARVRVRVVGFIPLRKRRNQILRAQNYKDSHLKSLQIPLDSCIVNINIVLKT